MRRRSRIILILLCGFVLLLAVGTFVLYRASQHVPEAYREVLEGDPVERRQAGEQLEKQVLALKDIVKQPGRWEVLFTAEEINGWLAEILPKKWAQGLPKTLRDPRVAIRPDAVMLFVRFRDDNFSSVITLSVEPYVPEPNVLALRIHSIRAGAVPWRLDEIVEGSTEAARRHNIQIQWDLADGEDPVARIPIAGLDECKLGDGEIYLSGTTGER